VIRHLVRIGLGVVICYGLWLTLWNLRTKVINHQPIVGQFGEDRSLTVAFQKPPVEQVDLFLLALITEGPQNPSVVIEWSVSSAGGPAWFTNHVRTFVLGTNRINLTGPGNISAVRNIMHGQQMPTVSVRVLGPKNVVPLSLGIQWLEVRRFYDR
jgi:hypothetical protein